MKQEKIKAWADAKKKHRLSDEVVKVAQELGLKCAPVSGPKNH